MGPILLLLLHLNIYFFSSSFQFDRIHLSIASSILSRNIKKLPGRQKSEEPRALQQLQHIPLLQCCSAGCSVVALQRWEPGSCRVPHLSPSGHCTGPRARDNSRSKYKLQLSSRDCKELSRCSTVPGKGPSLLNTSSLLVCVDS